MKKHSDASVFVPLFAFAAVSMMAISLSMLRFVYALPPDAPVVPTSVKTWDCAVVSNHDGDTVLVMVDHEWGILSEQEVRIYGVNAPELDQPAGKLARDHLAEFLPVGTKIVFTPKRQKNGKMTRSFVRCVGTIEKKVGLSLIDVGPMMVGDGFASWTDENGLASDKPPPPLK